LPVEGGFPLFKTQAGQEGPASRCHPCRRAKGVLCHCHCPCTAPGQDLRSPPSCRMAQGAGSEAWVAQARAHAPWFKKQKGQASQEAIQTGHGASGIEVIEMSNGFGAFLGGLLGGFGAYGVARLLRKWDQSQRRRSRTQQLPAVPRWQPYKTRFLGRKPSGSWTRRWMSR